MVVADASVWIDFFNARANPARNTLRKLLYEGDTRVVVPDLVLFEVLRGYRDERQLRQARALMMSLEVTDTSGVELCLQAAEAPSAWRTPEAIGAYERFDTPKGPP